MGREHSLRARYYDPSIGRFTQQDIWMGKDFEPISLNKYLYTSADPANFTDPSGHMNLGELGAASNMQATLMTIARPTIQLAMKSMGCELGMALVEETITYGIYVLFDGTNYYTGQSNDIDRRHKEHIKTKTKKDMKVVAMFFTDGGKDAMRLMEQYVMDVLELEGANNINGRNAIDKKRGRLRKQYKKFFDKVCK